MNHNYGQADLVFAVVHAVVALVSPLVLRKGQNRTRDSRQTTDGTPFYTVKSLYRFTVSDLEFKSYR